MNTKRLFLTSLLASTMVIGTAAYASPGGGHCGWKHGGKHGGMPNAEMMQMRLDKMAEKLGLSDEQKQQMKSMIESKRNDMEAHRTEHRALRDKMINLDPTASDYDAKLAEVANTKAAMSRQRTIEKGEMRKQMAKILTPEQQAKMKAFQQEHRRGGFRHGFGDRPDEN